jgi:hypothetical protein
LCLNIGLPKNFKWIKKNCVKITCNWKVFFWRLNWDFKVISQNKMIDEKDWCYFGRGHHIKKNHQFSQGIALFWKNDGKIVVIVSLVKQWKS